MTGPTCQRCGAELGASYRTDIVSARHDHAEVAPDGAGMVSVVLGAASACSWNCLAVLAAQAAGPDADAAVQVVAERERQVTTEGWTPEHDEHHPEGDLARAGALYAVHATDSDGKADGAPPAGWPWDADWWKPKDRLRDLVRAAALVAAEADREVRAKRQQRERF